MKNSILVWILAGVVAVVVLLFVVTTATTNEARRADDHEQERRKLRVFARDKGVARTVAAPPTIEPYAYSSNFITDLIQGGSSSTTTPAPASISTNYLINVPSPTEPIPAPSSSSSSFAPIPFPTLAPVVLAAQSGPTPAPTHKPTIVLVPGSEPQPVQSVSIPTDFVPPPPVIEIINPPTSSPRPSFSTPDTAHLPKAYTDQVFLPWKQNVAMNAPTPDPLSIQQVMQEEANYWQEWHKPSVAPLPEAARYPSNGQLIVCDCFEWRDLAALTVPSSETERATMDYCYNATGSHMGEVYMIFNGTFTFNESSWYGDATSPGYDLMGQSTCDEYKWNDGVLSRTRVIDNSNFFADCLLLMTQYCAYVGFPIVSKN